MRTAATSIPPWELVQWIPFQGPLPRTALPQKGWKEISHDQILSVKNKIDSFDSNDEWELRKKITNPYEAIFTGGSDSSFPSLAQVQPLSRSYFKMIEMLQILDFWNICPHTPFQSAHICEGPGGFLQATVEGLVERKIPIDTLFAMTLRPTKSNIPGWRRSIKFLKKYPQIQLEYGADGTGDILRQENQAAFIEKASGSFLFTADGGFDFSVDYAAQEQMAWPLLVASFLIGLQTLAKGGVMIIKLFDIYGTATQDLFLGSARFFEKFTLYKPATSRPCNSERYFIASGFLGKQAANQWIQYLQQVSRIGTPLT